jgi:Glycine zipper 2TM domain
MLNRSQTIRRAALAPVALLSLAALLVGCVTAPPPRPPPPPPAPPPPNTTVYAYPLHNQPPDQLDRDRYECSQWATQQTGFDPSAPGVPPHERVRVVAASGPPPGTNTAIGAVAGAVLGAVIAPRWQAAPAALAGAVVGGAIGSTADAANAQTNAINAQQAQAAAFADRRAAADQERKAAEYRRALSACLDGRGYSVR